MTKKITDYFLPDAREARRQIRLQKTATITGTFGDNIASKFAGSDQRITTQNAGVKAVLMARGLLDNYRLPSVPKLTYSGLRNGRTAMNSSKLEDGVITVHATFRTYSNVIVDVDIPFEIREGRMLEPSVIVHNGAPRIIAQSTFDHIIEDNTAFDVLPVREMYAQPLEHDHAKAQYDNRVKLPRVDRGMYTVQAARDNLRAAIRGTAVKTAQMQQRTMAPPPLPAKDVTQHVERMDEPWGQEDIVGELYELKSQGMDEAEAISTLINQGAVGSEPNEMQLGYLQDMWSRIAVKVGEWEKPWEKSKDVDTVEASEESDDDEKTAAKAPKTPKEPKSQKPPKTQKLKAPPSAQRLCSKCSSAPCRCKNKRKKKAEDVYRPIVRIAQDMLSKVSAEVDSMRDQGLGDLDIRHAIFSKYGPAIAASIFNK